MQLKNNLSSIVLLNNEHLLSCAKLYVQVFSGAPWHEPWDENTAKQRLQEKFEIPGFIGIGYFDQDELCGFAVGYCESWINSKHFYLKEMCVKANMQGKGIGSKLLQQLKEKLQALQVQKMYLLTMRESDAQHFYQKHGFALSEKLIVMGCNF